MAPHPHKNGVDLEQVWIIFEPLLDPLANITEQEFYDYYDPQDNPFGGVDFDHLSSPSDADPDISTAVQNDGFVRKPNNKGVSEVRVQGKTVGWSYEPARCPCLACNHELELECYKMMGLDIHVGGIDGQCCSEHCS